MPENFAIKLYLKELLKIKTLSNFFFFISLDNLKKPLIPSLSSFKIIISSYIFCFLFGAEIPTKITEDNGFNYTGKNNGDALVKFTNPEYAFDVVSDKNGKAYKKPNFSNSSSCLLYTSPSPRDRLLSRMPSSA